MSQNTRSAISSWDVLCSGTDLIAMGSARGQDLPVAAPELLDHWYPVCRLRFTGYASTDFGIDLHLALTGAPMGNSFSTYRRLRRVGFAAVNDGTAVRRIPVPKMEPVVVLGYAVVHLEGPDPPGLWAPAGLGQARATLGQLTGSDQLIGRGALVGAPPTAIAPADLAVRMRSDFERGVLPMDTTAVRHRGRVN